MDELNSFLRERLKEDEWMARHGTVDEMVAWLRRQLDDDQQAAEAATPGPWRWEDPSTEEWPKGDQSLVSDGKHTDGGYPADVLAGWGYDASGIDAEPADREHIARHDPARVLREVAAKRRILDLHDGGPSRTVPGVRLCPSCAAGRPNVFTEHGCPTLRLLASMYADRPGYRDAWRPT